MEKILIATILKPQGLLGEVKCKLENKNQSLLNGVSEVYLNNKDVPTKIAKKSFRFGYLFLKFNTVNSRDKADLLRNSKIYVLRNQLIVPEDEYIISDMIGLNVVSENNETIGVLKDVQNFGATDILIIEQYKREYMVPFVKDVVKQINTTLGIIVVDKQKYDEAKICD